MNEDKIELLDDFGYHYYNGFSGYNFLRRLYHNLYILINHLWHEETTPATLAAHLCFMVVSSFAFFFLSLFCANIIYENNWESQFFDLASTIYQWSNFFLNLLFLLIIIELSQILSTAYFKYKRDNL